MKRLLQQLQLEEEALGEAKAKAEKEFFKKLNDGKGSHTNEAIVIIKNSIEPITMKIKEYINNKSIRGKAAQIREPLLLFKGREKDVAYLVLSAIMDSVLKPSQGRYPPFHSPLTLVARSVVTRLKLEYKLKLGNNDPNIAPYIISIDDNYSGLSEKRRLTKKIQVINKLLNIDEYSNIEGVQLGVNLVNAVLKSGVDLINVTTLREGKNKRKTYVELEKNIVYLISNMHKIYPFFIMSYPPLIIEPKKWTGFYGSGGYYSDFLDIHLVKVYMNKDNRKLVANYFDKHSKKMNRFLDVINKIQATKWRINKRMLDVYNTIYREKLPSFESEYTYLGGLPSDELPDPFTFYEKPDYTDKKAYSTYKYKQAKLEEKLNAIRGRFIGVKLGLTTANKFAEYNEIYFSYQVDFRGRLYPIQQYLNPQSSKLIKPLLEFAEGKPLDTKEAYEWFMVHGANTYGYDKLLYDDRIKKMEEMKDEILRYIKDPFRYTEWSEAEEPFAFLSWCYEYVDYLTNPSGFVSHIPIALDATCSGIQIYSGLLMDNKGAEAVNVVNHNNNSQIADIYGDVATCVNKYLETKDYPKTLNYKFKTTGSKSVDFKNLADSMLGKITRKITKRNVMTFPYNVSEFGMKDQLQNEIFKPFSDEGKEFWDTSYKPWQGAYFLSILNAKAIGEVVKGAVKGRDFLKEITKEAVEKGKYIMYKTPEFHFPVVHRITKTHTTRITTALAKLSLKTPTTELSPYEMVNGIAPNFIHSLDATLMYLTVEKLLQDDVSAFALIHDSFGVHAKDVDKLALRVRESYIQLFEQKPLLYFVKQVAPNKLEEAEELMLNDLDLKEVLWSDYFFS